jgi:hypothetical protein
MGVSSARPLRRPSDVRGEGLLEASLIAWQSAF